jgi:hypothetical protein
MFACKHPQLPQVSGVSVSPEGPQRSEARAEWRTRRRRVDHARGCRPLSALPRNPSPTQAREYTFVMAVLVWLLRPRRARPKPVRGKAGHQVRKLLTRQRALLDDFAQTKPLSASRLTAERDRKACSWVDPGCLENSATRGHASRR